MRDIKYYIALDDFERRVVVNCLNEMRNKLIADDKYTDAVDEEQQPIGVWAANIYDTSNNTARCFTPLC